MPASCGIYFWRTKKERNVSKKTVNK